MDVVPTQFVRPPDLMGLVCTDDQLMQAVVDYLCGSPAVEISHRLGYAPNGGSGGEFIKKPGWRSLCRQASEVVREVALQKVMRLTQSAFDQIEDRLVNGDPIVSLEGEIVGHRPLKGKDLSLIATQMATAQATIEGRLRSVGDKEGISAETLYKAFERIAAANQSGQTIDLIAERA